MRNNILKALFVLAMLGLSACQASNSSTDISSTTDIGKEIKVNGGSYKDISVSELLVMMENKDFTLVNVHIPFEGDLPETDLSIAYDTIGQNLDKLGGNKTGKIVLYCRSDRMSTIAAEELVKLGYSNIWNLDGGMVAWEQAGQSIEK
ncbi:MAG: rhodanese-like domain-containing protein [Anaerolineaceae bacterium]|nr:rhodanese-like domain-containing protein [Anaerolineaceae bacterium]